jgi:hypothetical protein
MHNDTKSHIEKAQNRSLEVSSTKKYPGRTKAKNQIASASLIKDDEFSALRDNIEHLWEQSGIPEDLRQYYRDLVYPLPRHKAALFIKKEILDMKHSVSPVQIALKSVKLREEALSSVKQMNDRLSHGKINKNNIYKEAVVILQGYREASISAFESIMSWKQQMKSVTLSSGIKSEFQFFINGESYLRKMKSDTNFLKTSALSDFIVFSNRPDTFLIDSAKSVNNPGMKVRKLPISDRMKQIVPIPEELLEKYNHARRLLDEEDDSKIEGLVNLSSFSNVPATEITGYPNEKSMATTGYITRNMSLPMKEEKENREEHRDTGTSIVGFKKSRGKSNDGDLNVSKSRQSRRTSSHSKKIEILNKSLDIQRPSSRTHEPCNDLSKSTNISDSKEISLIKKLDKSPTPEVSEVAQTEKVANSALSAIVSNISKVLTSDNISSKNPLFSIIAPIFYHDISSSIYRNIIESILSEQDLESMIEETISSEIIHLRSKSTRHSKALQSVVLKLQTEKLAHILYNSILEECIESFDMQSLSQSSIHSYKLSQTRRLTICTLLKHMTLSQIEEMDNYTPGAHSPNLYSPNHKLAHNFLDTPSSQTSLTERTNELERVEPEKVIGTIKVGPVDLNESEVNKMLASYYSRINEDVREVLIPYELIERETMTGFDPVWLYLGRNKMEGLLVYSTDCIGVKRRINIHHLSSLTGMYELALQTAVEYIFTHDPCEEISLKVYSSPINQPKNFVIETLISKEFKLTAYYQHTAIFQHIQSFTLKRLLPHKLISMREINKSHQAVSIQGYTILSASNNSKSSSRPTDSMYKIGNRSNLINAILPLYKESSEEFFQRYTVTSLQEDLQDLLEIVSSIPSFKFPYMKSILSSSPSDILAFVQNSKLSLSDSSNYSASVLNLSFNLIGGMAIEHTINSQRYRYIRFRHPSIYHYKSNDSNIYILPTSSNSVHLLFIRYKNIKQELQSEIKKCRNDLFSKVESILNTISGSATQIPEIHIPAFSKSVTSELSWVSGFKLSSLYLTGCIDHLSISLNIPKPAAGLLKPSRVNFPILREDFIFGVISSPLLHSLESAVCVCLVEKEDMVK